tara:strand:- start:322 stop:1041 length:720 start_codon:yes stop_codon:yes gene_type:complete
MKTCSKCNVEKELTEFYKNKARINGCVRCKACYKEYDKEYRKNNIEKLAEKNKEYRETNKEKLKEKAKEYRKNNKKKIKEKAKKYNKKYYKKNKEKIKGRGKEYRENNIEHIKEYMKGYSERNKERYKIDSLYRLKINLRCRTVAAFRLKGWKKNTKTQKTLGCSFKTAHKHIERQFTKGMTWDNKSEWHIDHIIPLSSAKTELELMKLCHYRNLQPLWAKDNLEKGATIPNVQIQFKI